MLPEELSAGKTSLLENQDCLSVVVEFVVDAGGHVTSSNVYRALVRITFNSNTTPSERGWKAQRQRPQK